MYQIIKVQDVEEQVNKNDLDLIKLFLQVQENVNNKINIDKDQLGLDPFGNYFNSRI